MRSVEEGGGETSIQQLGRLAARDAAFGSHPMMTPSKKNPKQTWPHTQKQADRSMSDPTPPISAPQNRTHPAEPPSTVYDMNGLQNNDARSMLLLLLLASSVHPFIAAGEGAEGKGNTQAKHARARGFRWAANAKHTRVIFQKKKKNHMRKCRPRKIMARFPTQKTKE